MSFLDASNSSGACQNKSNGPHITNPIVIAYETSGDVQVANEIHDLSVAALEEMDRLGPNFVESWDDRLLIHMNLLFLVY